MPAGATFDTDINLFSWTPDYEDSGIYYVTFTVSDGSLSDFETVQITVNHVNRAPLLDSIGNKDVSEGSELSFTISANDQDSDSLTYSASGLPSGAIFNGNTHEFQWITDYDDSGTYEVTFTVSDGSLSDSETIYIYVDQVNRPPVLNTIGNRETDEDSELIISLSGTDPDSDSLIYEASDLPSGSIFNSEIGQFRWTPDFEDAGVHEMTFTVSDGSLSDSETIQVIVSDVNRAPVLDPIGNKVADEGSEMSFTISGSDADKDSLIYSVSDLPEGAGFNEETHEFIWTPDYDDSGTYEVIFSVSDGYLSDSEMISIIVGSVNRPPEMSPVGNKIIDEGYELRFTVNCSDPDDDTLTYSSSVLPKGAVFDESSQEFVWTPDYDDSGTYSITFTVSDGSLSDSETINIEVTHVNLPPRLMVIGPQETDEDLTLKIPAEASDEDEGDTLYYSVVDSPEGSEINESSGVFTWTPTYDQEGTYNIKFVVSDGLMEDTEDVTINVNNVNRPPVVDIPDQVQIAENSTLTLDLNSTDPDGDNLAFSKDSDIGILQEDIFTWTPGYDGEGEYYIIFTVTDGDFSISEPLLINVTNTNSAPVLYSVSDTLVNELDTVTIDLEAIDIDDDELTFSKDVDYGELTGNTFTWTPGINDSGFHDILFTVSDGQLSDSTIATIAVGNTNMPPVIKHMETQSGKENDTLTFTLNASDHDNDTLTYSAFGLPEGASLESSTGLFTWVPTYEQSGSYTVEFRVSDRIYTSIETLGITVENVNRAPVFDLNPMYMINETEKLQIDLNATDPDGDSIYFTTDSDKGSIIGKVFSWTTGYYDSGEYDLTFEVTDGDLTDNTTVHVKVNPTNMPPEFEPIGSQSFYENETLSFFVNATDGDNDSLVYSISGLPRGAAFDTSSRLFSWQPDYTQSGIYSVEFKVTDGELNISKAVSIRVYDVDLKSVADFSGFSTSDSGGSGGGSSSGAEDYENVAYKDYSIKYITQGKDIVFEFPNSQNDIEYVKFRALKAAGQVKSIIEILKDRSTLVSSSPSGKVYRHINIWVGDAKFNSGNYMTSAEISFKVSKQWFSENNADPSSIKLYRYSGGSWNELLTSRIGADASYYYYKSQTPGFSPFAIVSIENAPVSKKATPESSTTTESIRYSSDVESKLSSTEGFSDVSSMNSAPQPDPVSPVDTRVFLIGIIGILGIGSVLGYRSRHESIVLSRYYGSLKSLSDSVKNVFEWATYRLSSKSLHKDYDALSDKLHDIKSANYRAIYTKKISGIKEKQKSKYD